MSKEAAQCDVPATAYTPVAAIPRMPDPVRMNIAKMPKSPIRLGKTSQRADAEKCFTPVEFSVKLIKWPLLR